MGDLVVYFPGLSVFAIDVLYLMQPQKNWISRMWTSYLLTSSTDKNLVDILLENKGEFNR